MTLDGSTYWCQDQYVLGPKPCVLASNPVPDRADFLYPDAWCDSLSNCTRYNPDNYIEVQFERTQYICEPTSPSWKDQFNCQKYLGGEAPDPLWTELYCSGAADWNRECSLLWYPNSLAEYEFVNLNGIDHICSSAIWGFGNLDCYPYFGGDPAGVPRVNPAYCTDYGWIECSSDWYPREREPYEFVTIGGVDHICDDALTLHFGDKDCFRYDGGDPAFVVGGYPDQFCSTEGAGLVCDLQDYPSVWNDYSIISIDFREYICDESGWGDRPCVRYYGGSPSTYSFWNPDYTCDGSTWRSECWES